MRLHDCHDEPGDAYEPDDTDEPDDLARAVSPLVRNLVLAAAVGCGTVGGVFFAFSAFVMGGLTRLPPAQGMTAMQSINVTAVRPPLMTVLFGTAALCVGLAVWAVRSWGDGPAAFVLAACALYLIGTIALTAGYHVPHNDALALLDPASPDAAAQWRSYASGWTAWNHVRTGASLAALLLLVLALFTTPRSSAPEATARPVLAGR